MAVLCCLCITNVSSHIWHSKWYASLRSHGLYSAAFYHVFTHFSFVSYGSQSSHRRRTVAFCWVKTATFYGWKYNHYFVAIEEHENNLRAQCTLCAPSKKTLSSARNTTSNFKKHFDTVHKTTTLVEIKHNTGDSCTSKWKRSDSDVEIVAPQDKRWCMLVSKCVISLAKARSLISEYVIEDMLPLFTVESPAFRKLVSNISSG